MSYKVKYSAPFPSWAHTLNPDDLGHNEKSGWTVEGDVSEDYCVWVNDFVAKHPVYGYVKGNFEVEVQAKSKKAFDHFTEHHTPEEWDYHDI